MSLAAATAVPTETPAAHPALTSVAPAVYSVPDLAKLLQCSERHIWRQIDMGKIPGVIRFGRLVRLSRKLVDEWLASGRPIRTERRGHR
jgi:excisionase family DNA binding protein